MSQENSTGSREVMKGLMGVGGAFGAQPLHTLWMQRGRHLCAVHEGARLGGVPIPCMWGL